MLTKLCVMTFIALMGTPEVPTGYGHTASSVRIEDKDAESVCTSMALANAGQIKIETGAFFVRRSHQVINANAPLVYVDVLLGGDEDLTTE